MPHIKLRYTLTASLGVLALALSACAGTNTPQSTLPTPITTGPTTESTSSPSESATGSSTPAPSSTELGDAADAVWGDATQVVPLTGPVKLPAPKTEKAALEVTYEMVLRFGDLQTRTKRAKSTDTKAAEDFVTGQPLAQFSSDVKAYAEADWTFSGTSRQERILNLHGSYARTAQSRDKDGKLVKVPFGATWLRYCADTTDVEIVAGKSGQKPTLAPQKRRIFEAQALYNANTGRWFLTAYAAVEGTPEETTC